MENQQQQPNVTGNGLGTDPISNSPDINRQAVSHGFSDKKMKLGSWLRVAAVVALLFAIVGGSVYVYATRAQHKVANNALISQPSDDYVVQSIPLSDLVDSGSLGLSTTQSLSVNGQLRVNNSLVLAPMDRPINGTIGQVYYDKSDNALAYYDGSKFVGVANTDDVADLRSQILSQIQALRGSIAGVPVPPNDIATLAAANTFTAANTFRGGLNATSLAVSASAALQGSLSVDGQTTLGSTTIASLLLSNSLGVGSGGTGATTFAANSVLLGNGTDPISSVGTTTPDLCLMSTGTGAPVFAICPGGVGYGVNSLNGQMGNLAIANATAAGSIITLNDASASNKGIASFNATNLTVTSGSVNTVQNISSASTPTFAGLTLTSGLSVTNGGTGASAFTANGILIGNGTSALGSIATGSTGQCLIATAGAPSFQNCPTTPIPANVSSLNGLTGALVLNNSTGSGSSLTINDASTTVKGIARFNSTNFTVSGGAVNTVQNLDTSAAPTFAGINTGSIASLNSLTVAAALNKDITLATSGSGALYLSGYDCSASGNGGKLTVDATGKVSCGADGDTDTVGITEIVAGNGIAVSGNQVSVQLQAGYGLAFDAVNPNGLGLQACTNNQILKSNGSGWICASDNNTPGDGTGITSIGLLDSDTLSANGASISGGGDVLYLQSASNLNAGLVNTGAQRFAGSKTFDASAIFGGGLSVSTGQTITLGAACAAGEVLTANVSGVITCVIDSEGTDTTYTAGSGLSLNGSNQFSVNVRTGFGLQADGNGVALLEGCSTGEVLKRDATGWVCANDNIGTGDGVGVTAVGTIDSETKSANGAVINGSTIVLQNADGTSGGLVSAVAQAFGGSKTFNAAAIFGGGLSVSTGQTVSLGSACASGQVLTTDSFGVLICVVDSEGVDTNTTYTAGDGLSLDGSNQFSANIRSGFGLQADSNGISLLDTCSLGEVLKRTAGGWACGGDSEGNGITISGTYTDGRLTKFNATGQVMNSNLSESGSTLTYAGNLVVNAATGFNGNLIDLQLDGVSRFTVNHAGTTSVTGLFGAYGGIDTNNQNISAGNGTITGAINSTTIIRLNGVDINAGGTLSNVAYLDQPNTFTAANTFRNAADSSNAFQVQNTAGTSVFNIDTINKTINVGAPISYNMSVYSGGTGFAAKVDYNANNGPLSITNADFNADSKPDLAIVNNSSSNVSIFMNNGNGTYAAKVDYVTGANPEGVTTGDFNGDGKIDMAVSNSSSSTVSVFINSGTGTFAAKVDYAAGANARFIVTADFNSDGKLDLATTNYTSNNVSVFMGVGDGTFTAKTDYAVGTNPEGITTGDFNGDGKPDLATANFNSSNISVLINTGNGTFSNKVDYATGTNPFALTSADLNGDGRTDIAVAVTGASKASVFMNTGTGTFATKVDYTINANAKSIAVGDFNGDTKPDLVAASGPGASVLLNTGYGTFAPKVDYTTGSGPQSVTIADFDGDGKVDVATANSVGSVSVLINTATLVVTPMLSTASITASGINDTALTLQGIAGQANDIFRIQDSTAAALLMVANNGNVGIGNVPSLVGRTEKLTVAGAVNVTGNLLLGGSATITGATNLNGSALVKTTANSATAFQVQASDGTALLVADTILQRVTVRELSITYNLTVNGHIISGGSTPTIVAGVAACTTPTISITGTDTSGIVTVTTGTGCASFGKLATITFATAFGASPRITLTPATAGATGLNTYVDSGTISTTSFDIGINTTATNSTTYKWYYHVIQ